MSGNLTTQKMLGEYLELKITLSVSGSIQTETIVLASGAACTNHWTTETVLTVLDQGQVDCKKSRKNREQLNKFTKG